MVLADGSIKPISELKVGDEVLATDPETGETQREPIDDVIINGGPHQMVQITLEDNSPILATDQHPFWSETRAAYVPAVAIHQGEELRDAKNNRITVRSTRVYTEDLLAYNLTIRNIHTYYAGESPVLVHNCGDPVLHPKAMKLVSKGQELLGRSHNPKRVKEFNAWKSKLSKLENKLYRSHGGPKPATRMNKGRRK